MKQIDPAGLDDFLLKREERLYDRLLLNRVFKGTVTAVTGIPHLFSVQIQRDLEPAADGTWYPCYEPGYWPRIGDQVDLIWRDDNVAMVFQVLKAGAAISSRFLLARAEVNAATGPVATLTLDSVPSSARSLVLTGRCYGTDANPQYVNWRANGDTGNNYYTESVRALNAGAAGALERNAGGSPLGASAIIASASSSGYATGGTFHATFPGSGQSQSNHVFHSVSSRFDFGTAISEVFASWWSATSAQQLTSMTLFLVAGSFNLGTIFELYGDF